MSKISYISGSLHKISDQLSEAATKKEANPEEEISENFPETAAPSARKNLKEMDENNGRLKARYDELFRLKRDVIFRVTEHAILYASEAAAIQKRKTELDEAEKSLNALLKTLEECEMPELASENFKSKLADALRLFENARLEDIRTAAKMEGSAAGTIPRSGTAQTTESASFAALTGIELFKKGVAFFLPLILALLFATLLLSAAFFAAWKIAF